jgi:predicted nuclease with TOPRIM domain
MTSNNIKGAGLEELFEALLRLYNNNPERVPKDTKITLSSVALEAGKDPSLIRKGREIYKKLIEDIKQYAAIQKEKLPKKTSETAALKARIKHYRSESTRFEELWKAALGRELMLLAQLDEYELRWKKHSNVVDISVSDRASN